MRPLTVALPLLGLLLSAFPVCGQVPAVTRIGGEEFVSSTYMEHPSVATDSKAQPHMVGDFGIGNSFMKFHRVNGKWTGGSFATGARGGRYDASRLYIGQIEIDARDRAWISCKFGVKEWGSMYGQGLWLFKDVDTNPWPAEQFFKFLVVYKGMGIVSTDTKYTDEGVVLGTFGNWEKVNDSGQSLGRGTLNGGHGGEKVRFRIAGYAPRFDRVAGRNYQDGIWHTAMNGYSGMSSKYQNNLRYKAGLGPVTWAEYRSYPRQGDDYAHPSVGVDLEDPRICYIGAYFAGGDVCINVWDGNRMLFNPFALKVLDWEGTFEGRHGPQFAPAIGGGTFVFWTSENTIKMCYMSQKGVSTAPQFVSAGRSPGVSTDRYGNIHLVYYNGGIRYRKIQVSVLQGLEPRNRVTSGRTPRFRWSNTKSPVYTLEITRDGIKLPLQTCASNAWRSSDQMAVGNYTWRVKEGRPDGSGRWIKPVAFQIPPAVPTPREPRSRFPDPVRPVFAWTNIDPAANRFLVSLFSQGDLVDSLTVTGHVDSVRWPSRLPAAGYMWRVKAVRQKSGHTVSGDWSPDAHFQVAVPGNTAFLTPRRLEMYEPGWGPVTCSWTAAEGADTYTLKVLFNGELLDKVPGISKLQHRLSRTWQPGYYSLFVQPFNDDGAGLWSPVRTFIVDRQMLPGNGRTLAGPPRDLQWTRSKAATRYLVKLSRYSKTQKKYLLLREVWIAQPAGGKTPRWTPAITLGNGSYRWSATDYTGKKGGYTSVDYFQIGVPGAPLLLSPAGAIAGHRMLPFAWEDPSGFAGEFEIRVMKGKTEAASLDWTPAEDLLDADGFFARTWSLADDGAGAYTWRVRARNDSGSGPWREKTFTLQPLAIPRLTDPSPGADLYEGSAYTAAWGAIPGASHYQVRVRRGDETLSDEIVTGTNWVWAPQAGTCILDVRAGETGWSRWTNRVFTVGPVP